MSMTKGKIVKLAPRKKGKGSEGKTRKRDRERTWKNVRLDTPWSKRKEGNFGTISHRK